MSSHCVKRSTAQGIQVHERDHSNFPLFYIFLSATADVRNREQSEVESLCRNAELQEATCGCDVRHRYHAGCIPMRKVLAHVYSPGMASFQRRLLHLSASQTYEQTQCEEVQYLDATHKTTSKKQAEDSAKRRCEQTIADVDTVQFRRQFVLLFLRGRSGSIRNETC